MTLIERVVVDNKFTPFGLSNLRHLSPLNSVSPDQNSYSLSESLLELYACSFFLAFLNGLEHRRYTRQPLFASILFVGLMFLRWLTSILSEGLTIFVPATTLSRIVSLMGPAVSLALLAELFDFRHFWDSNDEPALDAPLVGFPFSGRAVAALSFDRCFLP